MKFANRVLMRNIEIMNTVRGIVTYLGLRINSLESLTVASLNKWIKTVRRSSLEWVIIHILLTEVHKWMR